MNGKIGIVGMSNGQRRENKEFIENMIRDIEKVSGEEVLSGDFLYETDSYFSCEAKERAKVLNSMFINPEVTHIFDISGGDVANEVLEYLDYDIIKSSKAVFYGYSDVSTVINAIYQKTGKISGLYQIRNIMYECKEEQKKYLREFILNNNGTDTEEMSERDKNTNSDNNNDKCRDVSDFFFIEGHYMKGTVIGGNIRCFLKLAGTEYMPDFEDKILFLEGYNTSSMQLATYFAQLRQMGAFEKAAGVLLGTFTKLDKEIYVPSAEELIYRYTGDSIAVARTMSIGHGVDSKCLMIGSELELDENR